MIRKLKSRGFAVVEALLIVVIVILLAGTGYYVWHTSQQTKATLDAASKSASSSPSKTSSKSNTRDNSKFGSACTLSSVNKVGTLQSIAKAGAFFCLPNGWQLSYAQDNSFYVADSLLYNPSTQGTITHGGGKDGLFTLTIAYTSLASFDSSQLKSYSSINAPQLENSTNVKASAYYHLTGKNDPVGAGIDSLPEGTKQYLYVVQTTHSEAAANYVVSVSYNAEPTQENLQPLVEALVASVDLG